MSFFGFEKACALAPMAGVTDFSYRTICAEMGADFTVTEMVSSRALVYQDKKSKSLLHKTNGSICGAQIFGNDPSIMAEAAVIAIDYSHCDYLDINMGCPMPKIANNGDGSALMRDPHLAAAIVKAIKCKINVPVTVKMRLGWDKGSINAVEFSKTLEDAGVDAIAVHGRTKTMLYSGKADWDAIGRVVQSVSIPVFANGDIFSVEDAIRCINHTGTSLLMVGRGMFGDPWLIAQIRAVLNGEPVPERPELEERIRVAIHQFELALLDKGEHIACLEARKHLAWYLRGVRNSAYYKDQISHISTSEEFYCTANNIIRDLR